MQKPHGASIQKAMLQAIDAAPADDALRLQYADWLDEQGGATNRQHAELLRIQCASPRTGTGAPDILRREKQLVEAVRANVLGSLAEPSALVNRALELRRVCSGFAGDMIAAIPPPDTHVEAVFRRGFLAGLTLDAALFILAAGELAGLLPRPSITVTGTGAYLRAFLECEHRQLVSGLRMQTLGNSFRVAMDRNFLRAFIAAGPWPRLTMLDLSSCSLGNGDARLVIDSPELPALADLDLSRNHLNRHLLRYFTRTPRWRTLRRPQRPEKRRG